MKSFRFKKIAVFICILALTAMLGLTATLSQRDDNSAFFAEASAASAVSGDNIASDFTDSVFRAHVYGLIGKNDGEPFGADELSGITTLDVSDMGINSLAGIGHFISLTELYCNNNNLTALDVSGLTSLTELYCHYNNLAALNVSGLTSLTGLYCSSNNLTALNVSGLTSLERLYCYSNHLTTLDVSGLTSLEYLNCSYNNLTALDVSDLTSLLYLYCQYSTLTTLDVSNLTLLEYLNCSFNNLTTLNISGLTSLTSLNCQYSNLATLDVSGLTSLSSLYCYGNNLTTLDISGLTSLTFLYCYNNYMADTDAVIGFTGTWDNVNFIFAPQKHNFEYHAEKAADCTEDGNIEYWYCSVCGKYFSDANGLNEITFEDTIITALGHDFGDWTVTTPATCTEAGVETRTCSVCGDTETRPIPALGHDFGDWTVTATPTATVTGLLTRTCANDSSHTETFVLPMLNTTDYVYSIITAAAELADGEGKYTYDKDGQSFDFTAAIPALGHSLIKVDAVAPTCETAGNPDYWTCSVCGKYFADADGLTELTADEIVIAPLPHNPDTEWESDADGHWHECSDCGEKTDEAAHTLAWVIVTPATETEDGLRVYQCSVCGYIASTEVIPATGSGETVYNITDGAQGSWNKGETGGYRIIADGELAKFARVKVDGAIIDGSNYTVASGSTVIVFNDEYLETLSEGVHTFEIVFTDGSVSTSLTVSAAENPDNGGLPSGAIVGIVIGGVLIIVLGGFAIFWFVIKKKSFKDLKNIFKRD